MWSVALNRGDREIHPVQIEKNLISVCLENTIKLFKCLPSKKSVGKKVVERV